jgi:transcriptional regulator with XRE-family HTH domain
MIRAAREARGLTQADLSYLEQDQREPSLSIAARIARELEIPLDELASHVTR